MQAVVAEGFGRLQCITYVPHPSDAGTLYRLDAVTRAVAEQSAFFCGGAVVSSPHLQATFEAWLPSLGLRQHYDVFVSYRWGRVETDFVDRVAEWLQGQLVSSSTTGQQQQQQQQRRRVEVFLDRQRLRLGGMMQRDFMQAMRVTPLLCPLVSYEALLPMTGLTATSACDNVLLEWTLMVELQRLFGEDQYVILPVVLGRVTEGVGQPATVSDLLKERVPHSSALLKDSVADVVVGSVVDKVSEFLAVREAVCHAGHSNGTRGRCGRAVASRCFDVGRAGSVVECRGIVPRTDGTAWWVCSKDQKRS